MLRHELRAKTRNYQRTPGPSLGKISFHLLSPSNPRHPPASPKAMSQSKAGPDKPTARFELDADDAGHCGTCLHHVHPGTRIDMQDCDPVSTPSYGTELPMDTLLDEDGINAYQSLTGKPSSSFACIALGHQLRRLGTQPGNQQAFQSTLTKAKHLLRYLKGPPQPTSGSLLTTSRHPTEIAAKTHVPYFV